MRAILQKIHRTLSVVILLTCWPGAFTTGNSPDNPFLGEKQISIIGFDLGTWNEELANMGITYSEKVYKSGNDDPCINPVEGGLIFYSQTGCNGFDPNPLTGTLPLGFTGIVEYKWQLSEDNIIFTDIENSNSQNFDPGFITMTTWFRRLSRVTCMPDWEEVAISNVVMMNVIPGEGVIWYVKFDATGDQNGSTWEDAYTSLQDALDVAENCDQIWVAAGIYRPETDHGLDLGDRGKHFRMKEGVAIYGGFVGDELFLNERDILSNETILSGDLDGDDDYTEFPWTGVEENCYHVLYNPDDLGLTHHATMDGFTICGGMIEDTEIFEEDWENSGAGLCMGNGSPIIANCIFKNNFALSGGGAFCSFMLDIGGKFFDPFEDALIVTGCSFTQNVTLIGGTGMLLLGNLIFLSNCVFDNNIVLPEAYNPIPELEGSFGGAIASMASLNFIENCQFLENQAYFGGAVADLQSITIINRCLFSDNKAVLGGAYANLWMEEPKNNDHNRSFGIPRISQISMDYSSIHSFDPIKSYSINELLKKIRPYNSATDEPAFFSIIQNSHFTGNVALPTDEEDISFGGGICMVDIYLEMVNCLLNDNHALAGGGIALLGAGADIINSTLTYNDAFGGGGGVIIEEAETNFYNSIIWGNWVEGIAPVPTKKDLEFAGHQFLNFNGSLQLYNSCFSNDDNDIIHLGEDWYFFADEYCLNDDPVFLDPEYGDFRVSGNSPCVDAGENIYCGENTDIRGGEFYRKLDKNDGIFGMIDMGAYEFKAGVDPIVGCMTPQMYIPSGWSAISSYIDPYDPDIVNLMEPVAGHLIVMLGTSGLYAPPPFNVNTLVNWNVYQGYKIKMNESCVLDICGYQLSDNHLVLDAGYHIMPVLTNGFAPIAGDQGIFEYPEGDILFIFELLSGKIYWPDGGIYTLTELIPGYGYLANFKVPVNISFPEYGKGDYVSVKPATGPWSCSPTFDIHLISVDRNAAIDLGADYLGAFDDHNNCIGFTSLDQPTGNFALAVYGDDPYTQEKDGAREGELLCFRSFNTKSSSEEDLIPVFDKIMPQHDGTFTITGMSKIVGFIKSASSLTRYGNEAEFRIFPNPASDRITIVYPSLVQPFTAKLHDTEGRLRKSFMLQDVVSVLDIKELQPGIYFIKVLEQKQMIINKLLIKIPD